MTLDGFHHGLPQQMMHKLRAHRGQQRAQNTPRGE